MKNYILISLLCLVVYLPAQSQVYLKGYTGYSRTSGVDKWRTTETLNGLTSETAHRLKFGQGLNLGLSIGYLLNKHITFEITGNTQISPKFRYSKPYREAPDDNGRHEWSISGIFGDREYISRLFQISPQVVFISTLYDKFNFYLKGGPNFMSAKFTLTYQPLRVPQIDPSSYLYVTESTGGINIGIQASFGVEYRLLKNVHIFAELTTVNTKYTFEKEKIIRYEKDGVDAISELESATINDLDYKTHYDHIGLNIGLKYFFNNSKK